MAVNIDVQIAEQNASVELPSNPDVDLSTDGGSQMAQEITQSPNAAMSLQNAIDIQSVSDAVTYYGSILNFSTIDVDGTPVVAESSSDTLELIAGEGVTLDVDGKAITIESTGGGGGEITNAQIDDVMDDEEPTGTESLRLTGLSYLWSKLKAAFAAAVHYHTSLGNASVTVLSVNTSKRSVSEGNSTVASGSYSHAEGGSTSAIGYASHAEGYNTQASGDYGSHAEGYSTVAGGMNGHAEGNDTQASGNYSHAEGLSSTASGSYSHAQNRGTIAASSGQTALGKFNVEDDNDEYAAIIGNGTADNARSNALAVRWNGLVDQAGRTAYPLFVYNGKPTEANAPITPCFIYDTSDGGLYYYSG